MRCIFNYISDFYVRFYSGSNNCQNENVPSLRIPRENNLGVGEVSTK